MGNGQSRMAGLRWDREEDIPECSGREISWIFLEKIRFREMAFGNTDLYMAQESRIDDKTICIARS